MTDSEEKKVAVELTDLKPVDKETELTLNELSGVSGGKASASRTMVFDDYVWVRDGD